MSQQGSPSNEKEEGPVVKFSDFVKGEEYQEKLENEMKERIAKDDSKLNRCTYNDKKDGSVGYMYQQVYSCRTCYEEQIKDKLLSIKTDKDEGNPLFQEAMDFQKLDENGQSEFLEKIENSEFKPKYQLKEHGFCLGCMLVCHEGHEVNELYCKLDFRCDCGNSRMPKSCELINEKDYENELNVYNQTFYDLYCHCQLPHDQEIIDSDKVFMLQCFNCEDWYHNTHMKPPIATQQLDDKYFLICSKCVKHKQGFWEVLLQYKQWFYEPIRDHIMQLSQKRQKLDDGSEATVVPEVDLILDDEVIENLKEEHKSSYFVKVLKMVETMENIESEDEEINKHLHGEVIEESESDKQSLKSGKNSQILPQGIQNVPLSTDSGSAQLYDAYFDSILAKTLQQRQNLIRENTTESSSPGVLRTGFSGGMNPTTLDPESQLQVGAILQKFKSKFHEFLQEAETSGKVVTKERVLEFFKEMNAMKNMEFGKSPE